MRADWIFSASAPYPHHSNHPFQKARYETRTASWQDVLNELGKQKFLEALNKRAAECFTQGNKALGTNLNDLRERLSQGDEQTLAYQPFTEPFDWAAFQVWGDGWSAVVSTDEQSSAQSMGR